MEIIGQRLKRLRESMKFSQAKIAGLVKMTQVSVNRYESGQATPPPKVLLWYADYFDVSMDYIYGRTDNPQGKLYEYKPKLHRADPDMEKFVEMCFDPNSPMNERLKQALLDMLRETNK